MSWAIRQIIRSAVVSASVVNIFDVVGLDKPNIGLLGDEFLAQVRDLPERRPRMNWLAASSLAAVPGLPVKTSRDFHHG